MEISKDMRYSFMWGDIIMIRFFSWLLGLLIVIGVIFLLSIYNLKSLDIDYVQTFWSNLTFISATVFTLIPFLLLVLLIILMGTRKWAFRVEKLSIGGFNVLFNNPEQLFKRQIKTYLDTKRTLFKIDFEHDNFKETLDSYFETYKYLRDEIKILGDVKKKKNRKKNSRTVILYDLSNDIIKELNNFLTTHQSNFRRWYRYIEISSEEKFYLEPIETLQKEYRNYDQFCNDFIEINKFFSNQVAPVFEINIEKWGIENA